MITRTLFTAALLTLLIPWSPSRSAGHRLPAGVMPVLGCWFWMDKEFEANGYKPFIDEVSAYAPYNFLTTSIRAFQKEVTDRDVHDQIKAAAIYAQEKGTPLVMDLDVRLARQAFAKKYPGELQEMVLLQEVRLAAQDSADIVVRSHDLGDHYTYRTTHYIPLHGSLKRIYTYDRDEHGIDPNTILDITSSGKVVSLSADSVRIRLPEKGRNGYPFACAMVSFTHLTPDVFAPHLLQFQRDIIQSYQDVQLAGVCKDEWGFPPSFDGNPAKDQFWYSDHRALAYSKRTGGRDLLEDFLLLHFGIRGHERQRQMAINHFMEMSLRRNAAIENDFYNTVKEVFGAAAIVATHPTWWPYPDLREFKKNGLDWWVAKRDWAQTDERTPFAVRTALAKKWGSPVWYNMYYAKSVTDYERSLWSYVLAGGRINYHPLYPSSSPDHLGNDLLRGDLMKAESRVRLLNFISNSPLDCPVAVIFGHSCAMNWAGPAYNDVGMAVADEFWRAGIPADLIPSSEIENQNLYLDDKGWICYGKQRYTAVIMYHPEFEKISTATFFNLAAKGPTLLSRYGDWTRDFEGEDFGGNAALPGSMIYTKDRPTLIKKILTYLDSQNIQRQAQATDSLKGFGHISSSPPATGFCRLIDGTIIQIAGTFQVTGDPIQSTINIENTEVSFDAIGIAAVNLDKKGQAKSLAAAGLKYFSCGDLKIDLSGRIDIALWKDNEQNWHGVIQDWTGPIPPALLALTSDWERLMSVSPLPGG